MIDLRERLAVGGPPATEDTYAFWFRALREPANADSRASGSPARPTRPRRLVAATGPHVAVESGPAKAICTVHDTTKVHDTSQVHDTTKVHDTSQVHDTTKLYDTSSVHKSDSGAPANAATRVIQLPTEPRVGALQPDQPAEPSSPFTHRERAAWEDLDDGLARVTESLRTTRGPRSPAAQQEARNTRSEVSPRPDVRGPVDRSVTADVPHAAQRPTRSAPPSPTAEPPRAVTGVRQSDRPGRGKRLLAACLLGLVALAGLVAVVASVLAVRDDRPSTAGPRVETLGTGTARALPARELAWLRDSTSDGARIAAPPQLQQSLSSALPGRVVGGYRAAGPGDLVVVPRGTAGTAADLPDGSSVAVTTLGSGLEIRQVLEPGVSWPAELAARAAAGRELVGNGALQFTPGADAVLRSGALDARLLTVLAGLALEHSISVDIPAVDPRSPAVVLAVRILGVDGRPVSDHPWGAAEVKAFLTVQSPVFTPKNVSVVPDDSGGGVLVVRYTLPSPPGLLGGAGFPTTL